MEPTTDTVCDRRGYHMPSHDRRMTAQEMLAAGVDLCIDCEWTPTHAIDCDMGEDCTCSVAATSECSRCHATGSDIEPDGLCPSCHVFLDRP